MAGSDSRRRLGTKMASRAIFAAVATIGLLVTGPTPTSSAQVATPPEGVDEPVAWIIVDARSGKVLDAKNAHEPLPPASIAKVMTALVAVERLPADSKIPISELAAAQPASKLGVLAGEEYQLDDAVAAMMLESANDVSYAVGEAVGGDLEGFADLANATAKRYGMDESEFSDPAGLDDEESFDGGPSMSAFDVAIMIRNAQRTIPIAKWAGATNHAFDGPAARFEMTNHNQLLPGGDEETAGVTGFKTGRTDRAGNTLATTATRGDRDLIVVVLNTPDTYAWTQYLLDIGFAIDANEPRTDETLPAPAVSVRADRERDLNEFTTLVTGRDRGETSSSSSVPDVTTFKTTAPITRIEVVDADAAPDAGRGDGGGISFVTVLLVVLSAGIGAIVVRREQIKRRRRLREQARRQRAAMIRRGSLPVVDGRYRTGQRTGNPPQAHIRVRKIDAPPDDDWEEWAGWDDEPPAPRR